MEYLEDNLGRDTIRTDVPAETAPRKDDPNDKLIGVLLEGRYLIERKLGQGGFGAVYLASDQKMISRKVVVKVLRDDETQNEWSARKFKHEIEALTRINHPNIVGVFDSGVTENGQPYIVMQYVNGIPLRALITPEGMQFQQAAKIIGQMGRALSAAHECGILHRDLKPENVMLENLIGDDEQVKIIDFGVARVKDSLVSSGSTKDLAVGTVAYMSPEQLSALPLTTASDVYSLGVISYEMLTGRRPSTPDSAYQLLELQRSGVRVRPADLRPSLPKAAEELILRSLSFEPKQRFKRARDFGDLLSNALLGDDEQDESGLDLKGAGVRASEESVTLTLETAHVLILNVVGYSQLLMDQQKTRLGELQQVVLDAPEYRRAGKNLVRLPTGDGMALVFFGDPEAPVRCAIDISRALRNRPDIMVRMGVHSGPVYRVADINTNMNVAGGGISMAQRIMEYCEPGHILLSNRVADDLGQLSRWSDYIYDLGETEIRPGARVHVFNLYGEDFGNPTAPVRFQIASGPAVYRRMAIIAAAALAVVAVMIVGIWYAVRPRTAPASSPSKPPAVAPVGPEQSLTYWLTVQKMLNQKPLGETFPSAGDIAFGNGWRFRFNLQPAQSGALYLLNVGPGKDGADEYDILFPLPSDNQVNPKLTADRAVQLPPLDAKSKWYQFVEKNGVEKFWIIWSTQPIPELDAIFNDAARNKQDPGVIVNPDHIDIVESYLKKYDSARPEVVADKSKKLTSVKGRGEVLVNLVELSHEAY